jgi:hypothetical protein
VKGEGDVTADKSEVDAVYKINLKASKLDFAKLQESFVAKKVIGGKGDLYESLTMQEKGSRTLIAVWMVLFLSWEIILSFIRWTSTRFSHLLRQARTSISSTSVLSSSPALLVPLRSRGTGMGTFTTRPVEGKAP